MLLRIDFAESDANFADIYWACELHHAELKDRIMTSHVVRNLHTNLAFAPEGTKCDVCRAALPNKPRVP